MSSALVPGRILRAALLSRLLNSFCCSGLAATGDSWSSGIGGGLGRRGDAGDAMLRGRWLGVGDVCIVQWLWLCRGRSV